MPSFAILRIANDIEDNLASYVATVTAINVTLGAVVAAGAWLFGFDNPLILGLLTAILNYIPYIGPACMVLILTAVGLVTFPTLGYALMPPAAFIALTTVEGHIITPTILGTPADTQPAAGVYRDRVLGVVMGSDRRVPGGADVDRCFGDLQPSFSGRGSKASRMRWNFFAHGPLAGQALLIHQRRSSDTCRTWAIWRVIRPRTREMRQGNRQGRVGRREGYPGGSGSPARRRGAPDAAARRRSCRQGQQGLAAAPGPMSKA